MRIFGFFKKSKFDSKKETFNIVESIAKCRPLYKSLIIKAHPDRHLDKIELAEEITKLLNQHRHNYAELIKLKTRIEKELV